MTGVKMVTGSRGFLYPILGAAVALICASGCFPACFRNWGLLCLLLIISFQDADKQLIPNRCIAAMLLLAVLFQTPQELLLHLPSVILTGSLLWLAAGLQVMLRRKTYRFLGGGDVKLLLVLGLFLGLEQTLEMLLLAGIFGLLTAMMAFLRREKVFPFGPGICAAAAMSLLLI